MDFDRGLVGPIRGVEGGFEPCGRVAVEVDVQAAGVVLVDPPEGGQLDVLDGLPRPAPGRSLDQLRFVVAVDRLGESIGVAIPDRPDRGNCPDLGETLPIADGRKL